MSAPPASPAALPPRFENRRGGDAAWEPEQLVRLAKLLRRDGFAALRAASDERLLAAWSEAVERFADPRSAERRDLAPRLAAAHRLSAAGLDAALDCLLTGVAGSRAAALFARSRPAEEEAVTLVVLASNVPALAVQMLLPAMARRRPVLIKSASAEPWFTPLFLTTLARREPRIGEAAAAVTWSGGDRAVEAPLLAAVDRIVAYGDATSVTDLESRAGVRLFVFGPRASVALVGGDCDPALVAPGLARDIALFDQRGCLSVQAIYTDGCGRDLLAAVATALAEAARALPPGPPTTAEASGLQQVRLEAEARGLETRFLDLGAGGVILETRRNFCPSPGLRTVRIHPVESLATVPALLAPWRGKLQGASLAGAEAVALAEPLRRHLGISRTAAAGELQNADIGWFNGGADPLRVV